MGGSQGKPADGKETEDRRRANRSLSEHVSPTRQGQEQSAVRRSLLDSDVGYSRSNSSPAGHASVRIISSADRGLNSASRANPFPNPLQNQPRNRPQMMYPDLSAVNVDRSNNSHTIPSAPTLDLMFDSLTVSSSTRNATSTTNSNYNRVGNQPQARTAVPSRVGQHTLPPVQVYTPLSAPSANKSSSSSNQESSHNPQRNINDTGRGRGEMNQRGVSRGPFRGRGESHRNHHHGNYDRHEDNENSRGYRRGHHGNRGGGGDRNQENNQFNVWSPIETQDTDPNSGEVSRGRGYRGGRQFNRGRGRGEFNRGRGRGDFNRGRGRGDFNRSGADQPASDSANVEGQKDRGGYSRGARRQGGGRGPSQGGRGRGRKRGSGGQTGETDSVDQALDDGNKPECPICMEFLRPPIYQCHNGHLVCEDCESKITECSICRDEMPTKKIRNRAIEETLQGST